MSEKSMKTRKEIHLEYKARAKSSGVCQIKNLASGKALLGSRLSPEGPLHKHRFTLSGNNHPNKELLKEWNDVGSDQSTFEILETVQLNNHPNFNLKDELTLL